MNEIDESSGSVERIRTPDPATFAPDIDPSEWAEQVRAARLTIPPIWNQPFEVLQPGHLIGRARTNTTLVDPTIVQTDVLPPIVLGPFAAFDMTRTTDGRAAVAHHFQASGYGSTGVGTFIFSFTVQTLGDETAFSIAGGAPGTLVAPGSVRIHGSDRAFTVTATVVGLPATAEMSIALQQTGGAPWRWFQTALRVPPPVFEPANL
ncbi:hypothetical protein ACGGZK_12615 [Agromyces sp. MMS24-K17]|uniref:hypothetical protein n=1 Tax=Agromyces sp. MMS24-K17 TaxID=3372850 RepID=UPI003753F1CD